MKVLILDNYDSFTYNLVQLVNETELAESVDVVRNDQIDLLRVQQYQKIILSPGPGLPNEAGLMPDLIREYSPTKSILGVCLGHQCMAECYGGTLRNLAKVVHGKELPTHIIQEHYLFNDLPKTFNTGRYHSWVVDQENFPDCLEVLAIDDSKEIMALAHKDYDMTGVQFHPESIMTDVGAKLMVNWLSHK